MSSVSKRQYYVVATTTNCILSTDRREPWIVYHAMAQPNAGWEGRTARTQKFGWNPDNSPDFGRPRGFHISLEVPSGTPATNYVEFHYNTTRN